MKTPYKGKVAIFTSFYNKLAFAPYIGSLATTLGTLSKCGIDWDYWCRMSDFHIERAVNDALTLAMNRDDITDILIIDSDESWKAEDVVRLLLLPGSLVGASYRMKNRWETYVGQIKIKDGVPVGKMMPDGKPLIEARKVSAGFMRIKKEVLKKYHDAYPEMRSNEEGEGTETTIFFERMRKGQTVYCQDMAFCEKLEAIGVDMWIDPTIKVSHWGFSEYEGDLDGFLKGADMTQASGKLEVMGERPKKSPRINKV